MKPRPRRWLPLFFLLVSAGGALWAAVWYRAQLDNNIEWTARLPNPSESRLYASTFDNAIRQKLVWVKRKSTGGLALEYTPCEKYRDRSSSVNDDTAALRLFCESRYGELIRTEIDEWNDSDELLGVRDNRDKTDACEGDADANARIFVPRGCKPNKWRAGLVLPKEGTALVNWIEGAEPPAAEFEMLADGEEDFAYQGDWAMLKAAPVSDGQRYRLVTNDFFGAANRTVTIDLVGRLRRIKISGKAIGADWAIDIDPANPPATPLRRDNFEIQLFLHCGQATEFEATPNCEREPGKSTGVPVAWQIDIKALAAPLGKSRSRKASPLPPAPPVSIELEAETANVPLAARAASRLQAKWRAYLEQTSDPDDERGETEEPATRFTHRATRHIAAECPIEPAAWEAECNLSWRTLPLGGSVTKPSFDVALASAPQTKLLDPKSGEVTEAALRLGLPSVVGLSSGEFGSLSWTLAQNARRAKSEAASPVRLTIDEAMQRTVQQILASGPGETPCMPAKGAKGQKATCSALSKDQTMTLALLDADSAPGEIKALASWPAMPRHQHEWDLQALELSGGGNAGIGWRATIPGQRPGSTFKAVTALAAVKAINDPSGRFSSGLKSQMSSLMLGAMPLEEQVRLLSLVTVGGGAKCGVVTGLPTSVNRLAPLGAIRGKAEGCVQNFKGAPYWHPANLPPNTGCLPARPGGQLQLGVCEATMRSSNLFFAGLSLMLRDAEPQRTSLFLEEVARTLSYDSEPCRRADGTSVQRSGAIVMCPFDLLRGTVLPPPRKLMADPVTLDVRSARAARERRRTVALAGFGDGGTATPLAIGSVYTSLAVGRVVRPAMVRIPRNDKGCPENPASNECAPLIGEGGSGEQVLGRLREGLHSAASRRGGTSFETHFPDTILKLNGRPRLFAKTGSATYLKDNKTRFALWTAGWIEGDQGPSHLHKRLAFVCHITGGVDKDTGGGKCAPVIRLLLENLSGGVRR